MENNANLPRAPRGFEELMTRREALAAAIYLPVHAVLLPLLLTYLAVLGVISPGVTMNVAWYIIGVGFTLIFLGKYLRRSFDALLDRCLSGDLRDGKTVAGVLKVYALRTRKKEEK